MKDIGEISFSTILVAQGVIYTSSILIGMSSFSGLIDATPSVRPSQFIPPSQFLSRLIFLTSG